MINNIIKPVTLLVILLFPHNLFSQEKIYTSILPSKVTTEVAMIIPNGESFIYEKYHYFERNYWVMVTDTLKKVDNQTLQGKREKFNRGKFTFEVEKCDSTINRIRNEALDHRIFWNLSNIAKREIGLDNKEFGNYFRSYRPDKQQIKKLCFEDFKTYKKSWFDGQVDKINTVKRSKMDRLEKVKSNSEQIDKPFIKSFLLDYDLCDTDHMTVLELIKNHPDDFLLASKGLSDTDFYSVKLNFSLIPGSIKRNEAIEKLKKSTIKTSRKGKLISALKKNMR